MESTTRDEKPRTEGDARSRLEQRISFPEGAAWAQGTPMAATFKDALCDALLGEDIERIRVRCGVTRDERESLRFMCKVEYAGNGTGDDLAGHPWSWWSPLAEKPEELVAELRRALRLRRDRIGAGASRDRRPPRVDKARGPSHDTWTTAPWDLGRNVRSDNFCRNRRARWTGHAAGAKPFRPRSPR
jgi:hypothetical protein